MRGGQDIVYRLEERGGLTAPYTARRIPNSRVRLPKGCLSRLSGEMNIQRAWMVALVARRAFEYSACAGPLRNTRARAQPDGRGRSATLCWLWLESRETRSFRLPFALCTREAACINTISVRFLLSVSSRTIPEVGTEASSLFARRNESKVLSKLQEGDSGEADARKFGAGCAF